MLAYPIIVITSAGGDAFPGWGSVAGLILVGAVVAIGFFFLPSILGLLFGAFLRRLALPVDPARLRWLITLATGLLTPFIAWAWVSLQGIDPYRPFGLALLIAATVGGTACGWIASGAIFGARKEDKTRSR